MNSGINVCDAIDIINTLSVKNLQTVRKLFYFNSNLMKFPKGLFNKKPALIQITKWCGSGDKSLSELMMTKFNDMYTYT